MLALVCADVLIQDRLLTKVFSALRTLVWLLTRVDAKMLVENGALSEGALAIGTRVRLLVSVYAQVLREVRLLPEPLATLGTPVRPAVRVNPFVLQQGRLLLEVLAAGETLEQPEVAVRALAGLAVLLNDVRQPRAHVRPARVLVRLQVGPAVALAQRRQHHARLLQVMQRRETARCQHVWRHRRSRVRPALLEVVLRVLLQLVATRKTIPALHLVRGQLLLRRVVLLRLLLYLLLLHLLHLLLLLLLLLGLLLRALLTRLDVVAGRREGL